MSWNVPGGAKKGRADYFAANAVPPLSPVALGHYTGGQWACHHMWSLLDADQEIPWVDQPLVFYHKWRIWVQPYNESYHTPLHYGQNTDLTIGSPYEYDVPKCAPGVPGCSMVDGTWIHTITGNRIGS